MLRELRRPSGAHLGHGRWYETGQVMILAALLLPVFLGMLGLGVDLGVGFASRRTAQNTADAAAYGATNLIIDNDPSCSAGSTTCMSFDSQDIYNALYDAVYSSDAPNHSSPTIRLYDPSAGGTPANTLGTIDVAAQFIDGSGNAVLASNGSSYLYENSTPIPSTASGLRANVSWPQQTYFGAAVGWKTYTVAAVAADVTGPLSPTQVSIAPFILWWDPGWGPTEAKTAATNNSANSLCYPSPPAGAIFTYPCLDNGALPGTSGQQYHPSMAQPYGPPKRTRFVIFGNTYDQDSGANPNPGITDPDYQFTSNNFKGYLGWAGSQPVCLGSQISTSYGNGNNGAAALTALESSLTMLNSDEGYATFAVADYAIKPSSAYVYVYDFIPLLVRLSQVQTAGSSGPWYGYVTTAAVPTANTSCPTHGTSTYFSKPVALQ